jgi:hypothetical protein
METGAQVSEKNSKVAKWVMIVVLIIFLLFILVCLGTRAAFKSMGHGAKVRNLTEVSYLDQALVDYKTIANSFPPCMGNASVESRQSRFYTHVTRAFPRYYVADFEPDGVRNYLDMRQQILTNFKGKEGSWYDLNTMDQAEALVFWLGGFPTPREGGKPKGVLLGQGKLLGFCASPTAPFFDVPGKPLGVFTDEEGTTWNTVDRRQASFQFDDSRLVDQDGDGWLEYIPIVYSDKGLVAPFVYFDGDLYSAQKTAGAERPYRAYPSAAKGLPTLGPAGNASAAAWGSAAPYAAALPEDANAELMWINPRKFQVICAGMDNAYGAMGPTPAGYSENLPKIFPAGIRYDPKKGDDDNLTNFSDGRQLGDAR